MMDKKMDIENQVKHLLGYFFDKITVEYLRKKTTIDIWLGPKCTSEKLTYIIKQLDLLEKSCY